jgi:phosphoribosyl 1,2-cyclic phosphodiesterase
MAAGATRQVGALAITAVAIPHDAAEPLAFVVSAAGAAFGHATDFGHVSRPVVEAFRECDALLVESNYDPDLLRRGPYPWSLKERILGGRGHLSNTDVARFLGHGLGDACRTVVLAHLSQKNNHPDLAHLAAEQALRRKGRTEVRLELCDPEGTGWIDVRPPSEPDKAGARQLRLF